MNSILSLRHNSPCFIGIKMALPIVLGYLPLGFAFGVLAVKSGIPAVYAVCMSVCVFAGSGQFIAASMIGMGSPIWPIILANFVVNLRYFLMSAALANFLSQFSALKRALFSLELTDEVFAVHYASFKEGATAQSKEDTKRIFACNITSHLGWISGTLLGVLSGEMLTDIKPYGLDFALPAMFIALLVPLCFERLHCIVAIFAFFLFLFCTFIGFKKYSVIIAPIIAALLGAYFATRKEKLQKKLIFTSGNSHE